MLTLSAEVLEDRRREERQREVAEHDRRHAREQLEHRLDRLAHARLRVLGQVDRGSQAERDRDDQRDDRDQEASRPRAAGRRSCGRLEQRRPLGAEQEVARRRPPGRSRSSRAAARSRCRSWSSTEIERRERSSSALDHALAAAPARRPRRGRRARLLRCCDAAISRRPLVPSRARACSGACSSVMRHDLRRSRRSSRSCRGRTP